MRRVEHPHRPSATSPVDDGGGIIERSEIGVGVTALQVIARCLLSKTTGLLNRKTGYVRLMGNDKPPAGKGNRRIEVGLEPPPCWRGGGDDRRSRWWGVMRDHVISGCYQELVNLK